MTVTSPYTHVVSEVDGIRQTENVLAVRRGRHGRGHDVDRRCSGSGRNAIGGYAGDTGQNDGPTAGGIESQELRSGGEERQPVRPEGHAQGWIAQGQRLQAAAAFGPGCLPRWPGEPGGCTLPKCVTTRYRPSGESASAAGAGATWIELWTV